MNLWKTAAWGLKAEAIVGCERELHIFMCSYAIATALKAVENTDRRRFRRHLHSAQPGVVVFKCGSG
jgi:hypothetical protein